jgi:hypothetical protein
VLQKVYVIGKPAFRLFLRSVKCDPGKYGEYSESFECVEKPEQIDPAVGVAFVENAEEIFRRAFWLPQIPDIPLSGANDAAGKLVGSDTYNEIV